MSVAPIFSAKDLAKGFGDKVLFEEISIAINPGERLALIGPNGSGKSTLLRIIAGIESADSGGVFPRRGLRSSYVSQEDNFEKDDSVSQVLLRTCLAAGLEEYEVAGRSGALLGRCGFQDPDALVSSLSGGWKKRLSILRGLVTEPELLLLDEPTNHLDIDGVLWLEDLLLKTNCALVFVSHDRYFIERLAGRVVEINCQYPQGFYTSVGDYADFLEGRAAHLSSLRQAQDSLANRVRREVAWLRQGAKARTTKSKHRSAEALRMVEELKSFQLDERRAKLEFSSSNRKTKELIKLEDVGKSLGGKSLFRDVSLTISPGVRLGVVGPNGSGKTTFVRTLLGEIKPDHGKIARASQLKWTFFDQARQNLDKSVTLKRALAPNGSDSVVFNDRSIHVLSWAKRFLFTNDQLSVPVSNLSGGEQARALLAQVMLQPADILFFDEPTNDLDITTLEILEESFCEFPGAIVLVTHDRYLLDRTATTVLGLATPGGSIFASYLQWEEAYLASKEGASSAKNNKTPKNVLNKPAAENSSPKALTSAELRELSSIESKISKAERELETLNAEMMSEAVSSDPKRLAKACEAISEKHKAVAALYARWEELEARR